MHFVQDDQLPFVIRDVKFRIGEPCAVPRRFEVEVARWSVGGDFEGERGLSNLPRPEKSDRRITIEQVDRAFAKGLTAGQAARLGDFTILLPGGL